MSRKEREEVHLSSCYISLGRPRAYDQLLRYNLERTSYQSPDLGLRVST